MEYSTISNWTRQARHRAKNRNIYSDLQAEDVQVVIEAYINRCAYCDATATMLDHPFPLSKDTPNIQANVLPCCKECRAKKKANDLVWMFANGVVNRQKYLKLLDEIFARDGGEIIKEHVKRLTGF